MSRYLLHDECVELGFKPYAVYGGKVYSFKANERGEAIPHGSGIYAHAVALADEMAAVHADIHRIAGNTQ